MNISFKKTFSKKIMRRVLKFHIFCKSQNSSLIDDGCILISAFIFYLLLYTVLVYVYEKNPLSNRYVAGKGVPHTFLKRFPKLPRLYFCNTTALNIILL